MLRELIAARLRHGRRDRDRKLPPSELLITGIPRSGTTLTAALVDGLEDAVCLSEPAWQVRWISRSRNRRDYVKRLRRDFSDVRKALLRGETVYNRRSEDGVPLTNYFKRTSEGEVREGFELAPIRKEQLSPTFLLAMKHNAHYTSVLPELAETGIRIWAVIRNPIPTILSWRSLDLPISEGRLPAGERFWPELREISARAARDVLEAQVRIYNLFCERYIEHAPRVKLLRYEDLVRDPDQVSRELGRGKAQAVPVRGQNNNPAYSSDEIDRIKEYLRLYCPACYRFYPDVEGFTLPA